MNTNFFKSVEEERDDFDRKLEPGTYELEFVKWSYRESASKGTPGLNFQFKVVNSDNEEDNGFVVFHWTGIESVFFRMAIVALCEEQINTANQMYLESGADDVSRDPDLLFHFDPDAIKESEWDDLDEAIGTVVEAELVTQTYQGKAQIKIKKFI